MTDATSFTCPALPTGLPGRSVLVGLFGLLARHVRRDLARCHGVDEDAVLGQLQGEDLGHHAEGGLGGAVGRGARTRHVLVHARHVDDAAPRALLDHVARGCLCAQEGTVEVGGDDTAPVVVRRVEGRSAQADAATVDHHVQAAQLSDELLDRRCRCPRREVLVRQEPALTAAFDLRHGVARALLVGMERDAHVVTLHRKQLCCRAADAGVGAGHDRPTSSLLSHRLGLLSTKSPRGTRPWWTHASAGLRSRGDHSSLRRGLGAGLLRSGAPGRRCTTALTGRRGSRPRAAGSVVAPPAWLEAHRVPAVHGCRHRLDGGWCRASLHGGHQDHAARRAA